MSGLGTRGTPRTRSLDKAIALLHAVADGPRSASALGRTTGIPRATVTRTLRTLADARLLEETAEGWVLGYELVRLGRAADPDRRLVQIARPFLERLRDTSGESALLGVPRDTTMLEIVLQLDGPHVLGVASWVGKAVPLYASAAGKLILAELDPEKLEVWLRETARPAFTRQTITAPAAIRREIAAIGRAGVAELVDELEDGLTSVSAPVREESGALAALVGLSGPTVRLTRARRLELRPRIIEIAAEIQDRLTSS
jgi:IclR family acetate operon transcriptional repressor